MFEQGFFAEDAGAELSVLTGCENARLKMLRSVAVWCSRLVMNVVNDDEMSNA